jgi:hypothetical protein
MRPSSDNAASGVTSRGCLNISTVVYSKPSISVRKIVPDATIVLKTR